MLGHLRGVNGEENGIMTYCMREEENIIIDAFYLFLSFFTYMVFNPYFKSLFKTTAQAQTTQLLYFNVAGWFLTLAENYLSKCSALRSEFIPGHSQLELMTTFSHGRLLYNVLFLNMNIHIY